jgi:magnesium-transporting ATPase (P-type)
VITLKNLNDKQKKVLGWVVLIVSFLWNTIYSFFIFIFVSLGEIFRYFYNDSFFGMLDSATYLFPDLEVWGWYFIISTIAFLIVYITYIVKSAKCLKENGLTKSLCQKVILFTFLFSVVQALPKIITMLE